MTCYMTTHNERKDNTSHSVQQQVKSLQVPFKKSQYLKKKWVFGATLAFPSPYIYRLSVTNYISHLSAAQSSLTPL